jgi:hypothetical protein
MNKLFAMAYERKLRKKVQLSLSQKRFDFIYNLTCRNAPNPLPKSELVFNQLSQKLKTFSPAKHLLSQEKYNYWFERLTDYLEKEVGLPFGYAQKFINVLMKDWCAENVIAERNFHYEFLHAPIDNIVADSISRYRGEKKPTNAKSLYANLKKEDYYKIQKEYLPSLGQRLKEGLLLNFAPTRLDVEQLIWGWV